MYVLLGSDGRGCIDTVREMLEQVKHEWWRGTKRTERAFGTYDAGRLNQQNKIPRTRRTDGGQTETNRTSKQSIHNIHHQSATILCQWTITQNGTSSHRCTHIFISPRLFVFSRDHWRMFVRTQTKLPLPANTSDQNGNERWRMGGLWRAGPVTYCRLIQFGPPLWLTLPFVTCGWNAQRQRQINNNNNTKCTRLVIRTVNIHRKVNGCWNMVSSRFAVAQTQNMRVHVMFHFIRSVQRWRCGMEPGWALAWACWRLTLEGSIAKIEDKHCQSHHIQLDPGVVVSHTITLLMALMLIICLIPWTNAADSMKMLQIEHKLIQTLKLGNAQHLTCLFSAG